MSNGLVSTKTLKELLHTLCCNFTERNVLYTNISEEFDIDLCVTFLPLGLIWAGGVLLLPEASIWVDRWFFVQASIL